MARPKFRPAHRRPREEGSTRAGVVVGVGGACGQRGERREPTCPLPSALQWNCRGPRLVSCADGVGPFASRMTEGVGPLGCLESKPRSLSPPEDLGSPTPRLRGSVAHFQAVLFSSVCPFMSGPRPPSEEGRPAVEPS